MPERDQLRSNPRDVPPVGRPRGTAWRTLQADGIVWEGQVYLVGDDVDLAARVVVTHRAVAFVRGGQVVLEIPRAWLRPTPRQHWDGSVVLSVLAPGSTPYTQPETVSVRMREGQPAAGHLVAILAGSGARLALDALPGDDFARSALPAIPERAASADPAPERPERGSLFDDPDIFGSAAGFGASARREERDWAIPVPAEPVGAAGPAVPAGEPRAARRSEPLSSSQLDPVVRQAAPPVSNGPLRDWNLQPFVPVTHLVPKSHRRNRLALALRLGGVVGLLAAAALFGSGHVPSALLGRNEPPPAPSATATSDRQGAMKDAAVASTSIAKSSSAAELTAVALGVGGGDAPAAPAAGKTESAAPAVPAVTGSTGEPTGNLTGTDVGVGEPGNGPVRLGPPPQTADPVGDSLAAPADTAAAAPNPATTGAAAPAAPQTAPQPAATDTNAPAAPAGTDDGTTANPAPAQPPAQAPIAGFAMALDRSARGASLPQYGLPRSDKGEWLGVVATVTNGSDAAIKVPLAGAQLVSQPDGAISTLDKGTGVVASLIGMKPALGPDDTLSLDPGESEQLFLLYLVPPTAESFTVDLAGATVDLGPVPSS